MLSALQPTDNQHCCIVDRMSIWRIQALVCFYANFSICDSIKDEVKNQERNKNTMEKEESCELGEIGKENEQDSSKN